MVVENNTQKQNPEHIIKVAGKEINLYSPTPEQAKDLLDKRETPKPITTVDVMFSGRDISGLPKF